MKDVTAYFFGKVLKLTICNVRIIISANVTTLTIRKNKDGVAANRKNEKAVTPF